MKKRLKNKPKYFKGIFIDETNRHEYVGENWSVVSSHTPIGSIEMEAKRLIPTLVGLTEIQIDKRFEDFWNQIDIPAIESLPNQPMNNIHKERMKESFIKHDGYFYPNEVWPEKFNRKFGS